MVNVAVLLPVYRGDRPEWLREAIDSVIRQNVNDLNINIYVGIDGPIDNDIDSVINNYSEIFHKVIVNTKNMGLPYTLNRLITELGTEEFVFRMDADDISCANRFQLQVDFMRSNPDVDILGGAIKEFSETGTVYVRHFYQSFSDIKANLFKGTATAHVTVCFRRKALEYLNCYSTKYPLNEDIELWFRAINKELKIMNLPNVLVNVRITDGFYNRRKFLKAKYEFIAYWYGCKELFGYSYRHLFVLARFVSRIMPVTINKWLYNGPVRRTLFP